MLKSIKLGTQGEQAVIALLNNAEIKAEKEQDKEKRYDHDVVAKIGRKSFTCEVKFDAMACDTGNLAIEYWNSKQDAASGLSVTKATLWIHIIKDGENMTIWAINTESLRQFVKDNKPFKKMERVGDRNSNIYLYKLDDILPQFTRLDNTDVKTVQKNIKTLIGGKK